jgi:hypothetical protein
MLAIWAACGPLKAYWQCYIYIIGKALPQALPLLIFLQPVGASKMFTLGARNNILQKYDVKICKC